MRYCCAGLNELRAPSSTRPGKERHVSGVAVEITANVGVTGLGIEEGMIGMDVEVGIGWIDGDDYFVTDAELGVTRGQLDQVLARRTERGTSRRCIPRS